MLADFARWRMLWNALEARGDPAPCHKWLVTAYDDAARHYHNLRHLEECLAELDRIRPALRQPATTEAALWFHDAVYDPRSTTNEEDSAALAAERLGMAAVPDATIELIRQLILSTKTHDPTKTPDGAYLIDIDLSILGQPSTRFWEYENAIRAEYAWVPATTFAQKRSEILSGFLSRPRIYQTEAYRTRYESTARMNLKTAVSHLRSTAT